MGVRSTRRGDEWGGGRGGACGGVFCRCDVAFGGRGEVIEKDEGGGGDGKGRDVVFS